MTKNTLLPRRGLLALGLSVLCSAAMADDAFAATLKISVPARVTNRTKYAIKTTGSYKQREIRDTAFLISFVQLSAKPCLATGALEFNQRGLDPYFTGDELRSPFTQTSHRQAGGIGPRRVCAYLYPTPVGPADIVTPIARATALYQIVK